MSDELQRALWHGDVDELEHLAPCGCCCYEHTHYHCPARRWGGCRGQGNDPVDYEGWARHYGMTVRQFQGIDNRQPYD